MSRILSISKRRTDNVQLEGTTAADGAYERMVSTLSSNEERNSGK